MSLLAAVNYDPATLATKSVSSNMAMTAFDTTNLRLSFIAPVSGNVLVRLATTLYGYSNHPGLFLGVMDGATVKARIPARGVMSQSNYSTPSTLTPIEAVFVIPGLTGGQSYTWDAAYAVEVSGSGHTIWYGGPNDTAGANAGGAFQYEVWTA